MNSEPLPKDFKKTTEVLPFTQYGLSSIQEFKEAKKDLQELEWLKRAGLTQEEMKLFRENKAGLLDKRKKMESSVMAENLNAINAKVNKLRNDTESFEDEDFQESKSISKNDTLQIKPLSIYPDGHPMNSIKDLEHSLFGHLKNDNMMPITKRRKILRRLDRKRERILAGENQISISTVSNINKVDRPGSLWDVKEMPLKEPKDSTDAKPVIGPKKQIMYTIKDSKIVRLEPVNNESEEYKAVNIVVPVNDAEVHLLEGTRISVDDIKKMDRFRNYTSGIPSKTLYLKNIAPSVTQEQLSLLFKPFTEANGRPIDVRLMSGRMRGQAFVTFQAVGTAARALEETNGTVLRGRPLIAQFGRSTDTVRDNR